MTKKSWVGVVILAFFIGGIGSILLGHFILPYFSNFKGLSWLSKITTNAPIVINRSEQIQLNEGVNLVDLIKQSGNVVVSIYGAKDNFLGNGLIVTSDGLIATSVSVLDKETIITVMTNDGKKLDAVIRNKDAKNGLAFLTVEASGLPIVQFDNASDLQTGQRIIYLGRGNIKFEHEALSGYIVQSLGNQAVPQISSDAVVSADFLGGPIFNLSGHVVGLTLGINQNIISENLKTAISEYLSKK